jgi:hypothetical protein
MGVVAWVIDACQGWVKQISGHTSFGAAPGLFDLWIDGFID